MHDEEQEKKTATISTIYSLIIKIRRAEREREIRRKKTIKT